MIYTWHLQWTYLQIIWFILLVLNIFIVTAIEYLKTSCVVLAPVVLINIKSFLCVQVQTCDNTSIACVSLFNNWVIVFCDLPIIFYWKYLTFNRLQHSIENFYLVLKITRSPTCLHRKHNRFSTNLHHLTVCTFVTTETQLNIFALEMFFAQSAAGKTAAEFCWLVEL